jgi:hypothetical protein
VKDENLPVDRTDELTVAGGRLADRVRTIGEYRETNMSLSRFEIEWRERLHGPRVASGWVPRTTENIGDLEPLPEEEPDAILVHT